MKLILGDRTYSSWSLRGWLAVRASGLSFEDLVLPLRTEEFRKEIYRYSPSGCVPCLIDGAVTVWDSLAIIDYLDRKCPDVSYWPQELEAYALARAAASEMHSSYQPLRRACPFNLRQRVPGFVADEDVLANVKRIAALWQECRSRFGSSGPFLFGEWGAVDMMFAPVVSRFETYGLTDDAGALAYMAAVLDHPHMREWNEAAKQEPRTHTYDDIPQGPVRDGFPE